VIRNPDIFPSELAARSKVRRAGPGTGLILDNSNFSLHPFVLFAGTTTLPYNLNDVKYYLHTSQYSFK
jgi:hypothetical protein